MKRVVMRIYRRTDYDLLSLMMDESFVFGQLVKEILVSYANNEIFLINIPTNVGRNISDKVLSRRVDFTLNEKDKREAKAIKLLDKIRLKKKNDFLKNLMRGYLSGPVVSSYFANDEDKKDAIALEESFRDISEYNRNVKTKNKYKKIVNIKEKRTEKEEKPLQNKKEIERKPTPEQVKPKKKPQKSRFNIDMSAATESVIIDSQVETEDLEEDFMEGFENLMAGF